MTGQSSRKAVAASIGKVNVKSIHAYKNTKSLDFKSMDVKKSLINSEILSVNSTDELSENNDIVDKTYFIKYDSNNNQVLLSEDENTWLPAYSKLVLYVGATYTFIQKNTADYNNSTNPFLLSTRNVYEKPRLFPLYDDNITYQIYNGQTVSWENKSSADPDGNSRGTQYYTQPLENNITQRRLIFSPSQHNNIYYITEQSPNITGGSINVRPNYYRYGAAIVQGGAGIHKNVNTGKNLYIDDIFILNNTNTLYTTDKVNSSIYYNNYYKTHLGVGTHNPIASLDLKTMKNAMIVPIGNDTTDKPAGEPGMIRYNYDINDFEARSATNWGRLGGLKDVDKNTRVELLAGQPTDDKATLGFYTENTMRFNITNSGVSIQHATPEAMLHIKGNMVMSNDTNVGGILTGQDLSLSDNYFNVLVRNSIVFKQVSGGPAVTVDNYDFSIHNNNFIKQTSSHEFIYIAEEVNYDNNLVPLTVENIPNGSKYDVYQFTGNTGNTTIGGSTEHYVNNKYYGILLVLETSNQNSGQSEFRVKIVELEKIVQTHPTPEKSIDIQSHNGSMIMDLNKNYNELINQNKSSQVSQNLVENITTNYQLILEKENVHKQNSSFNQHIVSNNQETYNHNYEEQLNSLKFEINNDSIETYKSNVSIKQQNTNKIISIDKDYDKLLKSNNIVNILNNNEISIKKNLNETYNKKSNVTIHQNSNINILKKNKIVMEQNLNKTILGNATTEIQDYNIDIYDKAVSNTFDDDKSLHIEKNLILKNKLNFNTHVNSNFSETLETKEVNMKQNYILNTDVNKTLQIDDAYTSTYDSNKTIHNISNKTKVAKDVFNKLITNSNVIHYKKDCSITTKINNTEDYDNNYSNTSHKPFLSTQGSTTIESSNFSSNLRKSDKTVTGNTTKIYKNNFNSNYETNTNNKVKDTVLGNYTYTYKNDNDVTLNSTSSKTINSDNSTVLHGNTIETFNKTDLLTIHKNCVHNYHNNVIVSVKNHVYNNINTDLNITVNKPSTVLYKDNSLINTDILNTINENTSTIVNKNDTDLTIKDNNNELHKSNYTTVNKELNLELNSVVSTKYNGNTLIIDNHATELYKNDSSITTENNEDIIIDNNYVSLQKKNTDDTINLNNNYLLKSNLIETYGTNHSNTTSKDQK